LDSSKVIPKYLAWYFRTPSFWNDCENASRGSTGRNQIKRSTFSAIHVPLPSLDEQSRIVARVEELAAKIHEAHVLRETAIEQSEILLHAMLRRERNNLQDSAHPQFQLGSITTVTSGGTPSRGNPAFWGGDIPWIKTGELLDGDISEAEERITADGAKNSSAKIFPADTVLVALYGQGQTRGRTGRLLISAATNQACCAILPKPEMFLARFIQFWLRSLYLELREDSKGGAQPNWNSGLIKELKVTLPSLAEQKAVVATVDVLQANVNSVRQLQSDTAAELDALLPSVLSKAFAGRL
jgi:restriction endonuclease S subunit